MRRTGVVYCGRCGRGYPEVEFASHRCGWRCAMCGELTRYGASHSCGTGVPAVGGYNLVERSIYDDSRERRIARKLRELADEIEENYR